MGQRNIGRLLHEYLKSDDLLSRLPLASGEVASLVPKTADTGAFHFGDGTRDMDVKVFLGGTGKHVLFDVGNEQVTLTSVALSSDSAITGGSLTTTGAASVGSLTISDGGTVTQATSKSTGVTLNTDSGQITMHNASLADDTSVSFTVTNSAVAAIDTVIVNIASAGTAGAYSVHVDAVAAGSFQITIKNRSGGALGEALVLNFNVIKGASS